MIYFDYSATTPVSYDVLDTITKVSKDFIGNANSIHSLGQKSFSLLESATKQIADIYSVNPSEIVYTSGATEANNIALIGSCLANHKRGKHIIVSNRGHDSIVLYRVNQETGKITLLYMVHTGKGPRDFNIIDDRYIVVASQEDDRLELYTFDEEKEEIKYRKQ